MKPIGLPSFSFDSPLAEHVVRLERARSALKVTQGNLDEPILYELRTLFQYLTSMMSARIEGNRTTVVDALNKKAQGEEGNDGLQEILNLEKASLFIDEVVDQEFHFTEVFVRELHRLSVQGLVREGDSAPGSYRTTPVRISQSRHIPPGPESISADMRQLLEFINQDLPSQYHLLQTAISHHRFVWIHPFTNGNGRVSRLLTYAMLVKQNFTSAGGYRALNPTVVFGADRSAYYAHLEQADSLENEDLIAWCSYVIQGLEKDLEHIMTLSNHDSVVKTVYYPALKRAYEASLLTHAEVDILMRTAQYGWIKAGDLADLIPGSASTRSQRLAKLIGRGLLAKEEGKRHYSIKIMGNVVTLFVVRQLDALGMLPSILRD